MLLLHGEDGIRKANIMMQLTDSICFSYCGKSCHVFSESIWVNSNNNKLDGLQGTITKFMRGNDYPYTHFILHTDKKKKSIEALIEWLDGNELFVYCRDVVVVCK